MSKKPTAIRALWLTVRTGMSLALLGLIGLQLGATVERFVAPVFSPIVVSQRVREGDTLCWTWHFTKYRDVAIRRWDISISDALGNIGSVIPYNLNDSLPMSRRNRIPVGPNRLGDLCIAVPRYVGPGIPVTVSGELITRGFMGLWDVAYPIPNITSE